MQNRFRYTDTNKRYHTYDYYLKHRYGTKCARIPIDAGFSCPNRENGADGCVYCSSRGAGDFCSDVLLPPEVQFAREYARLTQKWGKRLPAIPYFQAFSGTYAPTAALRRLYDRALSYTDENGSAVEIPALSIATRPDCLSEETVSYLAELNGKTDLTVELGLQSAHDATLSRIRRGHTFAAFLDGYRRLQNAGIPVCVHIINGLPTADAPCESREQMLYTASVLAELRPAFVKIHMLHVLRDTPLEQDWCAGTLSLLTQADYTALVCDQLSMLPPETVICRLTGDGAADTLLAPQWTQNKRAVLAAIDKTLAARDLCQGDHYLGIGGTP
ncbi:MAG: TIGR01212 family radical SAM protein [Ruminococcaceae bacterium]|nr:TIGR01212 family radical SAM protein [Oscillospiraceae bacterium]